MELIAAMNHATIFGFVISKVTGRAFFMNQGSLISVDLKHNSPTAEEVAGGWEAAIDT